MNRVTLVNAVFPSEVRIPPHGVLSIAASLAKAGISVEIRDYQLHAGEAPADPVEFACFLKHCGRILGISCMSYALPLVLAGLARFKIQNPNVYVVLGGIGPSGIAAQLMEFAPEIDAIVVGEGEQTFVELCAAVNGQIRLADVSGIVFREGTSIEVTRARNRVQHLEELPRPDYGLVDLTRYKAVDVQFQRGCPYPCQFCDIAPFWDRRVTSKSLSAFVDEIECINREYGMRQVFIIDDTFVLSRSRVIDFCDLLKTRQLDIDWACYARIDLLDRELTQRMARAGCRKIFFGIESGSERMLRDVDKGLTKAQIVKTVKNTLEFVPYVTTSFIWGFPGETMDEFKQTVDLLVYLASVGACPQFNLIIPYTYSSLYQRYEGEISFNPTYSSQIAFYGDTPPDWACEMISGRPDLFSVFYQLPTVCMAEKWRFLQDVGIDTRRWQSEYMFGVEGGNSRS